LIYSQKINLILSQFTRLTDGHRDGQISIATACANRVRCVLKRFAETFERIVEGGRTPSLCVKYHHMVDTIKIFITAERLADYNGHFYIVNRMLDIFSAAGHHQYAKGILMMPSSCTVS